MKTAEETRSTTANADKDSETTTLVAIRAIIELEIDAASKRGDYHVQIADEGFKFLPFYYKQLLAMVYELISLGYGAYIDDSGTLTVKW